MKLIIIGKIIKAFGIKGEVKLVSYCQPPANIFNYNIKNKDGNSIEIKQSRQISNEEFICTIQGISTRNDAENMQGFELYIERSDLKETDASEYYIEDLKGMDVKSGEKIIGYVENVLNYGAGDLLEIFFSNEQKTTLYPFTDEIFPEVNIQENYIKFIPKKII